MSFIFECLSLLSLLRSMTSTSGVTCLYLNNAKFELSFLLREKEKEKKKSKKDNGKSKQCC